MVITIIVMIILATAIILSLSNSGIIGKANKAKTDTDIASAKDIVAMAHADWMLDEAKIKENDNTITSFSNYAEKKLQEAGYKVGAGEYTVAENGEVYTGLREGARQAIISGIKIGDEVKYNEVLTSKSYTTDGSEQSLTGEGDSANQQTIKTNINYTWKYIGLGEDGSLLIAPDLPKENVEEEYKLTLGGNGGYIKGPALLNIICDKLYTIEGKGKAQSMNIDIVNKLLEYNGPKGMYIDINKNRVETSEPMTIGELEAKFNIELSKKYVPEEKDISMYKVDYYVINKTNHTNRITKDIVRQNLVYQEENIYWLASPCIAVYLYDNRVHGAIRGVSYSSVGILATISASGNSIKRAHVVRPYVSLISNIQKKTEGDKIVWSLS